MDDTLTIATTADVALSAGGPPKKIADQCPASMTPLVTIADDGSESVFAEISVLVDVITVTTTVQANDLFALLDSARTAPTQVNETALHAFTRAAMAAGAFAIFERAGRGELQPTTPLTDALGDFPAEFCRIRRALVDALTTGGDR